MAVSSTTVLTDAARLLGDTANIHWPADVLLAWLNEAQVDVVTQNPGANTTVGTVTCVAGARQSLPTGGIEVMYVQDVREIDKHGLDRESPAWQLSTASNTTTMWARSPTNKREFYVYPPRTGTPGTIDVEYADTPTVLTINDNIGLSDEFAPALVDYVCYRALAEDTDLAEPGRALAFRESYLARIGAAA